MGKGNAAERTLSGVVVDLESAIVEVATDHLPS